MAFTVTPSRVPETGSTNPCPHCHVPIANEHSLRESGICDGIRTGKIKRDSIAVLNAALRMRKRGSK